MLDRLVMADDVAVLMEEAVQIDQGALTVPLEQGTTDLPQPGACDGKRIRCDGSQVRRVGFWPPPATELGAEGDDLVDGRNLGEQGAAPLGEGDDGTIETSKALEHCGTFDHEAGAHAGVGVIATQWQAKPPQNGCERSSGMGRAGRQLTAVDVVHDSASEAGRAALRSDIADRDRSVMSTSIPTAEASHRGVAPMQQQNRKVSQSHHAHLSPLPQFRPYWANR
ncbi:MAG: hypothetical protein ACKO91_18515 [Acidimicrobiales bacterium]